MKHQNNFEPSEEFAKTLEQLDNLRSIQASEKVSVAGVLGDIKPAAAVWLDERARTDGGADLLERLNLTVLPEEGNDNSYIIAKDTETAARLAELFQKMRSRLERSRKEHDGRFDIGEVDESVERQIGELLGYPATAIDYYVRRYRVRDETDEEADESFKRQIPASPINNGWIILSPEHWREELEQYATPIWEATKQYFPKTARKLAVKSAGKRIISLFSRKKG